MIRFGVLLFVIMLACAGEARAQALTVELRDGVVQIDARGVSVRDILRRWSQVGGVSIENIDVVSPAPVTISLTRVTETQALRVLLRDVPGYVLAARDEGSVGRGVIGRILIAASGSGQSSSAPATSRPSPAAGGFTVVTPSGFNPINAVQAQIDPSTDRLGQADGSNSGEPPQPNPQFRPTPIRYLDTVDENGNRLRAPTEDANATPPPGTQKAPANPFGVTSAASTPGPAPAPSSKR